MAKEVIIGRVGVKVTAFVEKGIRKRLQAELEKETRGLEAEAELKVDSSGVKEEVEKTHAEIEKDFSDPIETELHVDGDEAVREARRARDRADKATPDIEKELHVKADKAAMKKAQEIVKRAMRDAKADLDISVKRNSRAKVQQEIEDTIRDLKADINVNANENDLKRVSRRIEDLVQRGGETTMNLKTQLDPITKAKMKREIERISEDITQTLEDLDVEVEIRADYADARRDIDRLTRDRVAQIDVRADEGELRSAQRRIEKIVTQIEDTNIKLKTELDERSRMDMERQIERLGEDLNDTIRDINAEIDVNVNKRNLAVEVAMSRNIIERQLNDIFAHVHPETDEAEVAAVRADIESQLMKIRDLEIKLKTDLDPMSKRKVEIELAVLREKLEGSIETEVDLGINQSSYARAWAQLKMLTKGEFKDIYVRVHETNVNALKSINSQVGQIVGNLTGARLLWDLHKKKFEAFKNFDQVAVQAGVIATQLTVAGAGAITLSGNILSIANDIGSVVGLIPAMVSGLGMAAAQGFILKSAFGDFVDRFDDIAEQFALLQESLSETFWSKASQPLITAFRKLFPQIEEGFTSLAASTGRAFGKLMDGARNALDGKIVQIFDNWSMATDILGDSMGDVASILATLLSAGSRQLPFLANGFKNLADDFERWLTAADKAGDLDRWFQTAAQNVKAFATAVWNAGAILATLGDYAKEAGAVSLQSLSDALSGALAVVRSSGFKEGFVEILRSAYEFTDQLGAVLAQRMGAIGETLQGLIPVIFGEMGPALASALDGLLKGFTSSEFSEGVTQMFRGIADGIASLSDALALIGPKLGIVAGFVGGMFSALMPVIGSFVTELATILDKIEVPVDNLLKALGPTLQASMEGIAPLFVGLGDAFAVLATYMTPVVEQLANFGPAISPLAEAFGNLGRVLAETIGPMLPNLAAGFTTFWSIVAPTIAGLVDAGADLLKAFQPFFEWVSSNWPLIATIIGVTVSVIISSITGLVEGVVSIIEGIKDVFGGLIDFLTGVFTGNWQQAWEGLKQAATGVWEIIKGALLVWMNFGILGILKGGLVKIALLWQGGWKGVLDFIVGLWPKIVAYVKSNLDNIAAGISSNIGKIKGIWSAGWALIKSATLLVWTIIKATVINAMGQVVGRITSAMSTAKSLVSAGWNMMKTATSSGVQGVIRFVAGMPAQIRAALSGLGSLLYEQGRAVLQGFLNGLRSSWEGVKGFVSGIAGWIQEHKGPLPYDRVLLVPAGKAIMGGLLEGLESQMPALESKVQRIEDAFKDADLGFGAVDTSEIDRLNAGRLSALRDVNTVGMEQAAAPGMVNNFEMHMGNQYTPEDISGDIIYSLRRNERRGAYRRE